MSVLGSYGLGYGSLTDPAGSSVLLAALAWLQATLLGTIATTIAVIAVSWVGLRMFTGHVDIRYGLTVIVGSFIIFGASTIATGIQASSDSAEIAAAPSLPPSAPPPALPPSPRRDPYAGASLPPR